jgi:hypothetical protein
LGRIGAYSLPFSGAGDYKLFMETEGGTGGAGRKEKTGMTIFLA